MNKPLQLKTIYDILGKNFYIPNYQRGYRWTRKQVEDLLNDIWAFAQMPVAKEGEFYCLQPIVVKQKQWENEKKESVNGFEVIDGQQRLTTIFLIVDYLVKNSFTVDMAEAIGKDKFTLRYETRPKSEQFLNNITVDRSNIDFHHISDAYLSIEEWFAKEGNAKRYNDRQRFMTAFFGEKNHERSVQVIWYHVDDTIDGKELFTRLNIGKIPLTNSELIKALFLNESSFKDVSGNVRMNKIIISQIWDDIEQNLNDQDFWAFITNEKKEVYSTKIDLLFDMIPKKTRKEIDPLYTFLYFANESNGSDKSLWDLWLRIEQYYLTLRQWYKDKNLYHKIGFLITTGDSITKIIETSLNSRKDEFEEMLNQRIREKIDFDVESLSYEKGSDYKKIERTLLLFNIESIRNNPNISEYYPFKFHKNVTWSIEHIHAQNSEGIDKNKKEPWLLWLRHHKDVILELIEDENTIEHDDEWANILDEIEQLKEVNINWQVFSSLSDRIIKKLSDGSDSDYDEMHSLSNLALIGQEDNSVLNNSAFEVKRRAIIEMDKKGHYIPLCTRRVFLKYYNNTPSSQHYYFWSNEDRKNYLAEIIRVLDYYFDDEEVENQDENEPI
jgi:hypothetical protein